MKLLTIGTQRMEVFRLIRQGLALLAVFVMLPTFAVMPSCGSMCSGTCDGPMSCTHNTPTNCPLPDCVVRPGCHCAGNDNGTADATGCTISGCTAVTDPAICATKKACEWGDACWDKVDCTKQTKDTCEQYPICDWVPAC